MNELHASPSLILSICTNIQMPSGKHFDWPAFLYCAMDWGVGGSGSIIMQEPLPLPELSFT